MNTFCAIFLSIFSWLPVTVDVFSVGIVLHLQYFVIFFELPVTVDVSSLSTVLMMSSFSRLFREVIDHAGQRRWWRQSSTCCTASDSSKAAAQAVAKQRHSSTNSCGHRRSQQQFRYGCFHGYVHKRQCEQYSTSPVFSIRLLAQTWVRVLFSFSSLCTLSPVFTLNEKSWPGCRVMH